MGQKEMNAGALLAVVVFALAFLGIMGVLYVEASGSHARGELSFEGIVILRWALLGSLVLYALLGITAILD